MLSDNLFQGFWVGEHSQHGAWLVFRCQLGFRWSWVDLPGHQCRVIKCAFLPSAVNPSGYISFCHLYWFCFVWCFCLSTSLSCRMRAASVSMVLLLCFFNVSAIEKKVDKLQIGIKKRVESCEMKSRWVLFVCSRILWSDGRSVWKFHSPTNWRHNVSERATSYICTIPVLFWMVLSSTRVVREIRSSHLP